MDPKKSEAPAKSNEAPAKSEPTVAELMKVIEELKTKVAQATVNESKPPRLPVVPGFSKWRLKQRHYRQGRMYEPGEVIEVENEAPGKTWERVAEATVVSPVIKHQNPDQTPLGDASPATRVRASDTKPF